MSGKPTKKKVKNRGAPVKHDSEKVLPNGLRPDQWRWVQDEAARRGGMSAAKFHRDCMDWVITAIQTKRADVSGSKLFDDVMTETEKV